MFKEIFSRQSAEDFLWDGTQEIYRSEVFVNGEKKRMIAVQTNGGIASPFLSDLSDNDLKAIIEAPKVRDTFDARMLKRYL